jgi:hypothetical protein
VLPHAFGEAAESRLGPIEMAIVVGRKEVAVGGIANGPHVDPVAAANVFSNDAGFAVEKVGWGSSPGGIANEIQKPQAEAIVPQTTNVTADLISHNDILLLGAIGICKSL